MARPQQHASTKLKSFRPRKLVQRAAGDSLRLIESALRLLFLMQRNRNDGDGSDRNRLFQTGNGARQGAPQYFRGGRNLLEFKEMNQVAQPAFVAPIGNGALEGRIDALAEQAANFVKVCFFFSFECFAAIEIIGAREVQGLSADRTIRSLQRAQCLQARLTNRKAGNLKEGRTTDTAIGGKESEE